MKKKENIYFLFLGIFLSFILILAIFVKLVLYIHNDGIKQGMGINIANSEEILNIVEKNCGSAGHVSQDAVRRYIEEQQGKDVFEYSVFGSPEQKIGDFTQSKLARWSN